MNEKYPDGTIVICVPILNWRPMRNLDDVVCERRDQDMLEATVKELRFIDGEAWLWPRSTDPEFQSPIKIPWPPDEDAVDQNEIKITAIVVSKYQRVATK